ncbi:MAG: extracellular solute-binding protein [Anaerolineaceae bacterium]|nr:extracellular solute-binding protein [Anaerolineaceae bacterium]
MKRKFTWILSSLLCLSLIAVMPVAAQEKVKVVIFVGLGTGTDPEQIPPQEALAERFNSTHDNIEIEFLIAPHEEATTRLLAMIAGGNAPQLVGPNGISTIAQLLDSWTDITPFIEAEKFDSSDFYGPAVALNEYPTINTGLPLGLYPSFIIYNIDMFDAAGLDYPPSDFSDKSWNMDKLREIGMKLTLDANGHDATSPDFDPENIVQWGYGDQWSEIRGLVAREGAPDVGRPTSSDYKTATANSPENIMALQWYSDGIWKDHFIPNLEQGTAMDSTGGSPIESGMQAMFQTHTWYLSEAINGLPFEVQLAAPPFNHKGERIAVIDADNFTIPKDAAHQQEAWEVMKWLTAPEQIVDVCLIYGCVPARKSAQEPFRTAFQAKFPDLNLDVIYQSIDYLDNPNNEAWVPNWGRVNEIMENAGSLIKSGTNKDAKSVLDETNAELQKVLDEYWASH